MRPTTRLIATVLLAVIAAFSVAVILTGMALAVHGWLHGSGT